VSLEIGGVFGPYGSACTIITPGLTRATPVVSNEFIAIAFPNPFASDFMFNVKTASQSTIQIRVYDMLGKQVENRKELFNYLREKNIFAQVHYIPAHLMPYYKDFGWRLGDMPFAENYYERCISIPIFPSLLDEEQDFVINTIKQFYAEK
jgi:dTDP-4-amino-4,6-dideoxygalactose transaminase